MKIFVAIPAYEGKLSLEIVNCLLAENTVSCRSGDELVIDYVGGSAGITHARNQLVSRFMKTDCEVLFFLDADITWQIGSILKLARRRYNLIGGGYRFKTDVEDYPITWSKDKELWANKDGLLEVDGIPTGFMCISRNVIEKMVDAFPERKQEVEGGSCNYFLFQMPLVDGILTGEDYYFCKEWKNLGGKVYLDPEITLTHWGYKPIPHVGHIGKWLKSRDTTQEKDK